MSGVARLRVRLRGLLVPATVLTLSAVIALGVAEMMTRYLYRDVTTASNTNAYFSRRWYAKHPPRKNGLGFRERELRAHPEREAYRIAVVGDSFTYGVGVLEEDRMTNILERRLNRGAGRRYEVVNFGRPGAETIHHIAILEQFVLGVHPHFILLQWYINDVEGDDKNDRPERQVRRLLPGRVSRWLVANSAFFFLADRELGRLRIRLGPGYTYQEYLVRRFTDPQSPDAREAEEALLRFVAVAKAAGIPVGIVAFPDLTGDLMGSYPLGFLIDRVMAVCREVSIPCVDLRPVFAQVSPPDRLWTSRLDSHPNGVANELAADAVLGRFAPLWRSNIRAPGELATRPLDKAPINKAIESGRRSRSRSATTSPRRI